MTFVMRCMVSPFGVDRPNHLCPFYVDEPRCFSVLRAYCLLVALHLIEARSLPGFMESVQRIIGFVISLHATGFFYSTRFLKVHIIIGLVNPLRPLGPPRLSEIVESVSCLRPGFSRPQAPALCGLGSCVRIGQTQEPEQIDHGSAGDYSSKRASISSGSRLLFASSILGADGITGASSLPNPNSSRTSSKPSRIAASSVSYTHLRAHETREDMAFRRLR